jgi:hypothetical protein
MSSMKRAFHSYSRLVAFSVAFILSVPFTAVPAFADPDRPRGLTDLSLLEIITDDDVFATADLTLQLDPSSGSPTQHYGPYPSGSPDSGTCGNIWAQDTFNRHFTVRHNPDGTFTVIQQFKKGSFETDAGASPGACDPDEPENAGGTVDNGITGKMHGYFIIPLPPGTMQTSTDPSCVSGSPNLQCTTAGFINSHFAPACYPATCPVTTFAFQYSAGGKKLVERAWKNASADRGGDRGDIRSSNVP